MPGIIKPFIAEAGKHLLNLIGDDEYRNYNRLFSKLNSLPRYKECSGSVHGWNLSMPDGASFLAAYKEIFLSRAYSFEFDGVGASASPKILDIGANIGLSVLYFKHLYPDAEVTAIEADPVIFSYLKKNIEGNGIGGVELINKAAWYEGGVIRFASEGADGGRIGGDYLHSFEAQVIDVDALDMPEYLIGKDFDYLKMDIEGGENTLLPAIKDFLPSFKYMMIEYHSRVGEEQRLGPILEIIRGAGFRYHIHDFSITDSPLLGIKVMSDFDVQLNIYCWKEDRVEGEGGE